MREIAPPLFCLLVGIAFGSILTYASMDMNHLRAEGDIRHAAMEHAEQEHREEAARNGHGEFIVDPKTGDPKFVWFKFPKECPCLPPSS